MQQLLIASLEIFFIVEFPYKVNIFFLSGKIVMVCNAMKGWKKNVLL